MVKQGYKQTEIGVIPEEWKIASLKDLSDGRFTYGVNAPAIPYAPPLPNYIRITDISDDGRFMRESRTSVDCQNPEMYTLKENDIVFARTGASTGKTYLYRKNDGDLVYAGFLIKASILPEKANSKYVFDSLHTNRYWDWVSVTSMRSGQPGINGNEYASYMIPCPSLPEQERIAEALLDVDSMISSLEKLIVKKKAVKDGAMAMLLTGRKRMAGFSKEWEFFQFKDTGIEIRKGQTITQKDVKFGNIPVVAGGKTPAYYCDKYNRDGKNITISASGASAGFVNIYSGKIFASDCSTISENEKYNIVFVYNMLKFLQSDIYASQTGGAQPHIHPNDIGELYLYYTFDIEEQNAIASVLSDMDNEIEALEQKLAKTRQIKQGMMQQLLTGKIRLNEGQAVSVAVQPAISTGKETHNHYFDDAVAIAAIVNAFYSERYPLGRKRVQKLLYLLRRKQEADTSAFKKKAAGPYADEVRYKGGEPIAKKNGYITAISSKRGTVFSKGEHIESALSYVEKWKWKLVFDWLIDKFKYTKTDELELLATIDMAMCDLTHTGDAITVDTIKNLIASNPEWKAKLSKTFFKDSDIEWAITMCKQLF